MSVACLGELLIDFVALEAGVTVGEASGFQKAPGGAPANVAAAVARLGGTAAFLGQVGDDPFGHYLAGVLAQERVDTRGLRFSAEARTALAFVSLAAGGERSFVFYRHPSADMLMRPEAVAYDVIDQCRIFHYGSITLIHEPSAAATRAAAAHARAAGKRISYDPNLRLSLWPNADAARTGMIAGLDGAHIVKISDEELDFLLPGAQVTDPDPVAPLWRDGMDLICVTRGERGAIAFTRDGRRAEADGFRVATVDTTGAGDSFVAALLLQLLEHDGGYADHLPAILRFACAAGAITTTGRGAIPSLPTREQVEVLLRS
ncbi:MAG: PfkB family carbohydrate kinase [bacterium]|nr:PfkB family carbohydrate kinase [bacterium]